MAIYTYTTNSDEDTALAALLAPVNAQRAASGLAALDSQTFWTIAIQREFQKLVNVALKNQADALALKYLNTNPAGRVALAAAATTVP